MGIVSETTWEKRDTPAIQEMCWSFTPMGLRMLRIKAEIFFGEEQLYSILHSPTLEERRQISSMMRSGRTSDVFAAGAPQFDDITLIVLTRDLE